MFQKGRQLIIVKIQRKMHIFDYSNHRKSEHPKTGNIQKLFSVRIWIGKQSFDWSDYLNIRHGGQFFEPLSKVHKQVINQTTVWSRIQMVSEIQIIINRTCLHLLNTGLVQYLGSVYTKCMSCSDFGHLVFRLLRDHSVWYSHVHKTRQQIWAYSLFTLLLFCTTVVTLQSPLD